MSDDWVTPYFVGLRHDELLRRMMDWETPYKSPGERRAFYLAILRAAEANGYEKAMGDVRKQNEDRRAQEKPSPGVLNI